MKLSSKITQLRKIALIFLLGSIFSSQNANAVIYTVANTTNGGTPWVNTCPPGAAHGAGSFAEGIRQANAGLVDTIDVPLTGCSIQDFWTPLQLCANNILIRGTAPGASITQTSLFAYFFQVSGNNNRIENITFNAPIWITGNSNVVDNVTISHALSTDGIRILGGDNNTLSNSTVTFTGVNSQRHGVFIAEGANSNRVEDNNISGFLNGVLIGEDQTAGSLINNNLNVVTRNTVTSVHNIGIWLRNTPVTNTTVSYNTISNTEFAGIYLLGNVNAHGNQVRGNVITSSVQSSGIVIETSPTSTLDNNKTSLNTNYGIQIIGSASCVIDSNKTFSNGSHGIFVEGGSSAITFTNNISGSDSTETTDLGNLGDGIRIDGGSGFIVGQSGASNMFVFNGNADVGGITEGTAFGHGITFLGGVTNSSVVGNVIGTNRAGTSTTGGNWLSGIYFERFAPIPGNDGNVVGGSGAGEGNIVGNNGFGQSVNAALGARSGIQIWHVNGTNIIGNFVGTNGSGSLIPNYWDGIIANGSDNLTIGGNSAGEANIVAGARYGITLRQSFGVNARFCANNTISGNYVGSDPSGTTGLGPSLAGINIEPGHNNNTVGGPTAAEGNIVRGVTAGPGIWISGSDNTGIYNNLIGNYNNTNAAYENQGVGILVNNDGLSNDIGSSTAGNTIAYKATSFAAIQVEGGGSDNNTIRGNVTHCNAGRGIELNNTGNNNYASSGSGGSAELYVNNASVAPNFLGISPANATIDVYEIGTCHTCSGADNGLQQGLLWIGQTIANASGDWTYDVSGSLNPAATGIVVTATDASGNTSEFSQCATVCTAPPSATLSPSGTIDICSGDNQLLTATPAGWHYTFMQGAAIVQSGTSATYTASAAGTYTVLISDPLDTANTTCQLTSNAVTLNVNSLPNTSAITGTTPVCDGDVETYSVTNTVGSSYNWTVPAGANITGGQGTNSITVDWSGASSGNVSVTETNSATCVGSAVDFAVTVNSLPSTSAISGPTPVCEGDTTSYTVTNTVGSSYSWTVPSGANILAGQGSDSISVDWGGASSGNVSVTETNAAGCTASSATTLAVTVNSRPTPGAITGNSGPACSATGESYTVSGGGSSTFLWTVPTGATIVSGQGTDNIIVDFGTSNGFITVTETNPTTSCVSDPVQLQITLSGCGLSANFSGTPLIICVGESVTFTDLSAGNPDSWTWDFGAGANPATANTQGPHVVQYTTPGSKTVQLVVTEGAAVDTLTEVAYVTVNDTSATSSISGTNPVCANETGTQYFVSGGAGSTYSWTTPGGTTIVGAQDGDTITVDWGTTGGLVTVQETNASGCTSAQQSMNVTVNPFPDDPGPITGPTGVVCDNGSGNTYTFSIPTVANADTVIWTVPAGATIVSGQGTTSITVDFGSSGTGLTVSVAASNTCGPATNPASFNLDVTQTETPQVFMTGGGSPVCGNEAITYTAVLGFVDPGVTYQWYIDGVAQVGETSDMFTLSNPVDGQMVTVEAISSLSCVTQASDTSAATAVSVLPTPNAEAGPDQSYPNPQTVTITSSDYRNNTTATGVTYSWWAADSTPVINPNPLTLFETVESDPTESATKYYLLVDNGTCTAIDSMFVTINFDIYIPSGFTPNNDGSNDVFQIKNIDKYPGNKIWIYNRWGSLVYEGEDYGITEPLWNGQTGGKDLPMATYYYILDLNNGSEQIAGPVTIIK